MLLVVLPIFSASQTNIKNKLNTKQEKAIQINNKDTSALKSNINKPDSNQLNIKSFSNNDSLLKDSNYLPRTAGAIKSKVKYFAEDSIVYNEKDKTAWLFKSSKVEYEDLNIVSEDIKIDLEKTTVSSFGREDSLGNWQNTPVFKQGKDEYKAKQISYNYNTKRGFLKELKTQEGEGFIKAAQVKRDEDNNLYNKYAYYTTCDAEHPHFFILADKIKIIPGKKAITGPAVLMIEDVPTPLAVPFAMFPLKRGQQSGLIVPAYGFAPGRGYFLRQGGYYWGLGDHADISFIGDIFTNLSWALGARSNYNFRYRFNGNFNFNYAYNKQGLPEDPNYNEFKTFELRWSHRMDGKARPNTNFSADVNLVGNQYLAFNSYNTSQQFNNQINSSISFNKSFAKGKYNISSNARASQNTQTRDLNLTIPDVSFTMPSFQPFKARSKPTADKWFEKISVNYTGLFQNNISTKDSTFLQNRSLNDWKKYSDTAFKYGFRHNIPIQTSVNILKYYTLSFGADYSESWTFNTIRRNWNNNTRQEEITRVNEFARAYQFSLRSGLATRFYGQKNFKTGRLVALRHVMNPNVDFSFSPDFSDASWGFYKTVQIDTTGRTRKYSIFEQSLYGGPGMGRQGNIGFNLDNNFEMKWRTGKDTAQKIEKIKLIESLRIGTSYNIFADSLKLNFINISGITTLFKTININGNAVLDPYYNQVLTSGSNKFINRINQLYLEKNGSLGKLTNANIGLSWGLNQTTFENKNAKADREAYLKKYGYMPLNLTWALNIGYTINYDYRNTLLYNRDAFTQTLSFNGNFNPTKNWFVNFNSGYDFINNKISHLGIDLRRDLHCWQFTFNWTPLSAYGVKYFIFQINVKSSVLQDLKIPKRKDWFDTQ